MSILTTWRNTLSQAPLIPDLVRPAVIDKVLLYQYGSILNYGFNAFIESYGLNVHVVNQPEILVDKGQLVGKYVMPMNSLATSHHSSTGPF